MGKESNIMLCLGKRIRQARIQAGITQEEMANHLGISRTAIARYEQGEIEPKLKNLIAISEYLNISTDSLLGLEKEKESVDVSNLSNDAIRALNNFVQAVIKQGK